MASFDLLGKLSGPLLAYGQQTTLRGPAYGCQVRASDSVPPGSPGLHCERLTLVLDLYILDLNEFLADEQLDLGHVAILPREASCNQRKTPTVNW